MRRAIIHLTIRLRRHGDRGPRKMRVHSRARAERSPWPSRGRGSAFFLGMAMPPSANARHSQRRMNMVRLNALLALASVLVISPALNGQQPTRTPATDTADWLVEGAARTGDVKVDQFLGRKAL